MGPLLPPMANGGTSPSPIGATEPWVGGFWEWDLYAHHCNFETPVAPLAVYDSRDTEGHGLVNVKDKNNGYCLLSSVPGTLLGKGLT